MSPPLPACRRFGITATHIGKVAAQEIGAQGRPFPYQKDVQCRASVHFKTIQSGGAPDGKGAGSGSEYSTVSRDTARVSATYSRCSPLASAWAMRAGSTTIT